MGACTCQECGAYTQGTICAACELHSALRRIRLEREDPETYGDQASRAFLLLAETMVDS